MSSQERNRGGKSSSGRSGGGNGGGGYRQRQNNANNSSGSGSGNNNSSSQANNSSAASAPTTSPGTISPGNANTGGSSGMYTPGASPPTMYQGSTSDPQNVFPSSPYNPVSDLFMNAQVRQRFTQPPPRGQVVTVASAQFAQFQTISCLEAQPLESSMVRGMVTCLYHTTNRFNGKQVVLRRIVGASPDAAECNKIANTFRHFRHPNLVALQGIVPTQEFVLGSNDVVLEYKYIQGAVGVPDAFLGSRGVESTDITESLAWSFANQLVGLLRTFHECDTPLRGLHATKLVYVESAGRVYFSGLGLMELAEATSNAPRTPVEELKRRDLQDLGLVLLQLVTKNIAAVAADVQHVARTKRFSSSFTNLLLALLEGKHKVGDICRALGERLTVEVAQQQGYADLFFHDLAKEIHNGRLMRLMIKLNFLYGAGDLFSTEWNETGERYVLRMFYNYVFNQVDDSNRPRLDWGHVYTTLNKLDCGSEDLIQLISGEDQQAIMVVSFKDLKSLIDRCFESLSNDATSTAQQMVMGQTPQGLPAASPMTPML